MTAGTDKKIRMLRARPELNDGTSYWIIHPRYLQTDRAQDILGALEIFMSEGRWVIRLP